MKQKNGLFTREIRIHPDFPDPDKPEEPVAMAIAYILSAENRAVTFRLLIHDFCDEKRCRIKAYTTNGVYLCDIASHSVYDDEGDHKIPHKDCRYLGGEDCYSVIHTGSGYDMLRLLQLEKEDEFWKCMEKYFYSLFNITPQGEAKIKTTTLFWDCECDKDYIKSAEESFCEWCGVGKKNCPDSRVNEVAVFLGIKEEEVEC